MKNNDLANFREKVPVMFNLDGGFIGQYDENEKSIMINRLKEGGSKLHCGMFILEIYFIRSIF